MTSAPGSARIRRAPVIAAIGLAFAVGAGLGALFAGPGLAVAGDGSRALPIVALGIGVTAALAGVVALRRRPRGGDAEATESAGAPPTDARWRRDFALEAAGLGFWELDLETRQLQCDTRARALLGLSTDEIHHEQDWIDRLHDEDRVRASELAHEVLGENAVDSIEYRVVLPDGRTRWIEDIIIAHHAPDGRRRLVGLVRDGTERRGASDELRSGHRRALALAEQNARFLAMMSHEIRTPMTSILGMLELLMAEPDSQKQAEHLAIARSSARSLLTILNDVLAFSRLEVGAVRLAVEPVRPRRLVADLVDLLIPTAEEKGVALSWTMAPEVPEWVVADPTRLRQVLLNLLSNAIKFTDEGAVRTRIDLHPSAEPGRVQLRFEVQDSGIGIAPELITAVFESFVREEAPHREGTGLGLAIAKQLVELMGGSIALRSTPGLGTVATFDVPVEPLATAPAERKEAPAPPAAPMRILVAEDNATNQYLVRALLEREGHQVTSVNDGAAAVRAVESGTFDVILMDVQMPVMDGATAARTIRAAGGPGAETPIIALTANALSGDRSACLDAGMSDYVSKPIEMGALNEALARAALARRGRAEAPPGPRAVIG
jgi:PAS domain S-box-containing protein